MNAVLDFWVAVRHLLPVLIALAALVLLGFMLDTKLSDRKW